MTLRVGVGAVTCTGQEADLDAPPEVTVKLAVYVPAAEKVLLQLADVPVHAPVHEYVYVPFPPDATDMKFTFWLMLACIGEAEHETVKS